jgi:SAM-dependent methyltransferase
MEGEPQDLRATYDTRYAGEYRRRLSGYEVSRYAALGHFIPRALQGCEVRDVLDYGAGRGMFVPLWRQLFPAASLAACDISNVALEKLAADHPDAQCRTIPMVGNRLPAGFSASFDLVVSVEVLEHAASLQEFLTDIFDALRPGGFFIWTTPCANAGSIEHLYATLFGKVERSTTGERRWSWEDPTHLRRLTTREAEEACRQVGFESIDFALRSHLFSFLVTYSPLRRLPAAWGTALMNLDYRLFRRLPNGASMIGIARKPSAGN